MKLIFAAVLIVSSLTSPAIAEDKIDGTFSINEDKSFSFAVEGAAAKALYNGMKGKAVREECTGGLEKTDGSGLHCIKGDDGRYDCDFGYNFKAHAFDGSGQDC